MGTPARQAAGTALVTGASSGIGEALAGRFAAGGYDLVLVARSADKLRALAGRLGAAHRCKVWVATADLTQPEAPAKLAAQMRRARRPIDILVNNAGVLAYGPFVGTAPARHREMVDLNVAGLTQLLAQFVPPMVARGKGRVLNVASVASFQPVPSLATYAATKAYVLSLTESLSQELQGTGVTVTTLCPGITATRMLHGARSENRHLESLPDFIVGDADAVAAEGYDACMAGEVIRVPGVVNQAATLASRATPRWLLRQVAGVVARRMK
jgi:hypothetical protein